MKTFCPNQNREQKGARFTVTVTALLFLILLLVLWSVSVGSSQLDLKGSFHILAERVPGLSNLLGAAPWPDQYRTIVFQLRLPRILLALISGGGLAVVGAVYQAVFRNPLADPHILGISSGAAFGATVALLLGFNQTWFGIGSMGLLAFAGSLLTVFIVYGVSDRKSMTTLILVGVALNALLSSLISLLMIFQHDKIERVYLWTMGSFNAANWKQVLFLSLVATPCFAYLLTQGRHLNILLTGEEEAMTLGLDVYRCRRRLVIVSTLLVAAIVSVSGIIGFVGLIIPHYWRILQVHDMRRRLPLSLLLGAAFLVFCDTLARTAIPPTEIPVGTITSLFGVPYFLYILLKQQRRG